MDKALKDKWSRALRSGEYQQGQCALLFKGKYCCLGVLCLVLGREIENVPGNGKNFDHYGAIDSILGIAAREEFIAMNDTEGKSFIEIADYIDDNL